jgi:broad specificity phosphatase PhoE
MKIYLVRHGQSVGNVKNLWYGSSDLPLTDLGREQARQAGEKLRDVSFSACYASPLIRAHDTAKLVMEGRNRPIYIVSDLEQQHMGLIEPKSVPQIKEEDPDFFGALMADWVHITPPEGEPFDTGLAPRVAKVLDELVEKGEDCLIVAHNGPLVFALSYLLGLPIEAAGRFYLKQGCFSMVEIDKDAIYNPSHALLRYYNV